MFMLVRVVLVIFVFFIWFFFVVGDFSVFIFLLILFIDFEVLGCLLFCLLIGLLDLVEVFVRERFVKLV